MTKTPFFMRFVETPPVVEPELKAGASGQTNKWPSDYDEVTKKYPSDDDEGRY